MRDAKLLGEDDALNPTSRPDPRFSPADDEENARAHADADSVDDVEDAFDADEVQAAVREMLDDALEFYQTTLEPDQTDASDYYWGRPYGNEKENRSQATTTDVRDAVIAMLPSAMRVIFSADHVVEYEARRPDAEEAARQATDYVRMIVAEDNPGFLQFHACLKDGMVRRLGVLKWWWETEQKVEQTRFRHLTEDDIFTLAMDDAVDEVNVERRHPDGTADATVTHRSKIGRAKFRAIPNEQFLFTPDAPELELAPLVAHSRPLPKDQLIAMGIPRDVVEAHAKAEKSGRNRGGQDLSASREFHGGDHRQDSDDARPKSSKEILFTEAYVLLKLDPESDGPAERRLFWCLGEDWEIVGPDEDGFGEIVSDLPFSCWTPEPEPHTIVGMSYWDKLKDVQLIKSQILRLTLDNLSEAANPSQEVVAGEVNVGDLLKPDASRLIRVRRPGMIREIKTTFVGGDTIPMLDYFTGVAYDRTGSSKGAQGLDADALQSTTKQAVAMQYTAAQQQTEMLVRVFCETALKGLFRGLLKLVIENQDVERVTRLRGKYVAVDPRSWDADMDVRVNVALGQGTPEDRVAALSHVIDTQLQLLANGSPLVSNVELRYSLAKATELAGFPACVDQFYRPWDEQHEQEMRKQQAQQPPPPNPLELAAQVEQMKVQVTAAQKAQELKLKELQIMLEHEREQSRIAREHEARIYEIEAKYAGAVHANEIDAAVRKDESRLNAEAATRTGGAA